MFSNNVILSIVSIFFGFMFFQIFIYASAEKTQYEPLVLNEVPKIKDDKLQIQTVAEGLEFPTSMDFLDEKNILVTEKNKGTVKRIVDGKVQATLLDMNVVTRSERGMLGVAIPHDNVSGDKSLPTFVYLYYTKNAIDEDSNGTRSEKSGGNGLYRYELSDNKLSNPHTLLHLSPAKGVAHNGGAIIIGPDNKLYIPIGDGDGHTTLAQNVADGGDVDGTGGILQISQDGSSHNNFTTNSDYGPKYYAYGIRNSFGIDFDPITGNLWDTENGNNDNDEINLVEPGFNSGWSKIMGIAPSDFNFSQLVTFDGRGKYSDPEFVWNQTVGPTKIKFLNTDKLGKQYENDIFVSDVKYGRIYHFDLNDKRDGLILSGKLADKIANKDKETKGIIFGDGFGGISDMKVGPDGYLYILSFGHGKIYRIIPSI